jgi:hypothetical protein
MASRMAAKTLSHAKEGRSSKTFAMKGGKRTRPVPSREEVVLRDSMPDTPSFAALQMTVTEEDSRESGSSKILLLMRTGVASRGRKGHG